MKHRWWRSKEVIGDRVVVGDGQFYPTADVTWQAVGTPSRESPTLCNPSFSFMSEGDPKIKD
jgi:hypothetical protein